VRRLVQRGDAQTVRAPRRTARSTSARRSTCS